MLLRSSSTPVLGSLLPSFTESPSNILHSESCHTQKHLPPTSVPQHQHRRSFSQIGSFGLSPFSCNSSPISPSIADLDRQNKGFRRVQSEGNLEDLVYNSCSEDRFSYIDTPKRFSGRQRCLTLETIPSFSISKHRGCLEEDEVESDTEDEAEYEEEEGDGLNFSVVNNGSGVVLTEDLLGVKNGFCRVGFGGQEEGVGGGEMYLAKGLGVGSFGDGMGGCRGGGGGGGDHSSMGSSGNDGDMHGVEEYYKKMVEESPGDPLFLRNYAQFLYQVCSNAILVFERNSQIMFVSAFLSS